MYTKRVVIILALVLAVLFSGCVDKAPESGSKTLANNVSNISTNAAASGYSTEVKIGALQSLTGDLGAYGGPMTDGIKLAVEEVNSNGGVLGKQVKLLVEDDQTSNIASVDAANKLIKIDKVPAIIGCTGSGASMSIIDIAVKNNVLMISSSNTGVEFTNYSDNDLYFRTAPSDALQGAAMAKLAKELGYKTASTFVINNPYGKGFEDVFVKSFESMGGKVVKSVTYTPSQTIFDSEVSEAFSANPNFIMLVSYPETGSLILKTAYEKGLLKKAPWILSEGLFTEKLADNVGKNKDGNYIIAGFQGLTPDQSAGGSAYLAFKEKYSKKFGREPGVYCSSSYDAIALVLLAMEKAKAENGKDIALNLRDVANPPGTNVSDIGEALKLIRGGKDINYQGASGEITFDEHGDVNGAYTIWTVENNGSISFGRKVAV
jgi:neutral amino acid transport system substrate-binding protein